MIAKNDYGQVVADLQVELMVWMPELLIPSNLQKRRHFLFWL